MKDMGIRFGSAAMAQSRVIGKDTVYIHTDITKITEDSEGNPTDNLYQYHEIQYDKDEYIAVMDESLASTQEAVDYLLMNQ